MLNLSFSQHSLWKVCILWDITPHSPKKVNQHEAGSKQVLLNNNNNNNNNNQLYCINNNLITIIINYYYVFTNHNFYTGTTGQVSWQQQNTTCQQLLKMNKTICKTMYNIIPFCSISACYTTPVIQYKAINVLTPPKTQDSHVKQSITQFVRITVQRPSTYFCISKLAQTTKLPSILVIRKQM
jgi:hypothetical protein